MKLKFLISVVVASLMSHLSCGADLTTEDALAALEAKYNDMVTTVGDLARQTMLQQLFIEERIRSDGDSGVKMSRAEKNGPQNYYASTHARTSFNAIHDHADHKGTCGMGEIIAVLNGVEFRTRHNDYKLVMPSTTSTDYHAVEPIPYPDVPSDVSDLEDVEDQVQEMREWFKAFADQDYSVRDYRKHFKPALCYLEGAWTLDKDLEEPFQSDRHQLDASSWFELQQLVRYSSYTGTKSREENYAYLPTTIMSVNKTTGLPNYAQWNYRILCKLSPVDIPFSYLRQLDDLSYRYPRGLDQDQVSRARGARYKLYDETKDKYLKSSLIDEIFYTIPGKDNLPQNLSESSFGEAMFRVGGTGDETLNTGYYHRWFRFSKKGAMGTTDVSRGFNDENLWVAQTTQNRVAPVDMESCKRVKVNGKKQKVCETYYTRFSWAIPLEIVYLTPLLTWNPYKLDYLDDKGKVATADGRNGANEDNALNGTYRKAFYQTPASFFSGKTDKSDPADTVKGAKWVLDPKGTAWPVKASGIRITLPDIGDIQKLRLRYPIAPVHGEGSSVWKELNALRDMMIEQSNEEDDEEPITQVSFSMSTTSRTPPGEHNHEFVLSIEDYRNVKENGGTVQVTTNTANNHEHTLVIRYRRNRFEYSECDGETTLCWDKHPRKVMPAVDV